MIHRDSHGIICQHDIYDEARRHDGGDSVNRTAIMAICGSTEDADLLGLFSVGGIMVRHPYQEPWNNPNNCSRDQLIPYVAALWAWEKKEAAQLVLLATMNRKWRCQNTERDEPGTIKKWYNGADWLAPDHRLHLKLAAGALIADATFLERTWLDASIFWSTKVKPESEQNQIICQCLVAGPEYVKKYAAMHPNFEGSLRRYWGTWRDQREIAELLINKVREAQWG
jgi:hypothetical protein